MTLINLYQLKEEDAPQLLARRC